MVEVQLGLVPGSVVEQHRTGYLIVAPNLPDFMEGPDLQLARILRT